MLNPVLVRHLGWIQRGALKEAVARAIARNHCWRWKSLVLAFDGHAHTPSTPRPQDSSADGTMMRSKTVSRSTLFVTSVALVHHDLARGDAQRVRAVVPTARARPPDAVATATGDELDGMTDVRCQDALQRAVHFLEP